MKCLQGTFKNREETLNFINSLSKDDLYKGKERVYKLKHTYDVDLSAELFIKSTFVPEALEVLIAFIMYKAFEINEDYDLGQENIIPILCELYGCEQVSKGNYHIEFDLYLIWEKWCGLAGKVLNTEVLNNSLLESELEKILFDK